MKEGYHRAYHFPMAKDGNVGDEKHREPTDPE